jgi:four helix bundle protein
MDSKELEERTKRFSVNVIQFVSGFPRNKAADVVGYQLLKSATSIGANYREATRAESKADFIHKIGVVEKEANETLYWLELVQETIATNTTIIEPLLKENHELLAIFAASRKTAKKSPISNCQSRIFNCGSRIYGFRRGKADVILPAGIGAKGVSLANEDHLEKE